ncbi:hypothetical protein RJT34_23043 [Clitoria ternatea]|uniref:Uncharacterized protein n=1 Tax=Clitoria ternatea TaxID=43366 RepID=A0AAN9FK75_CLITE
MQGKMQQNMVPSPSQGLCTNAKQASPDDDSETFYLKLTDLLEPSGLTLIINVRETVLDLYLFYLEVARRGGYHQVGREKQWGEVVCALKLVGNTIKLCAQVEKLYALLLYQFEQLYFYRRPAKQAAASSTKGSRKRKHNSTASLSQVKDTNIKDEHKAKEMSKDGTHQMTGAGFVEQPVILLPPSNDREMKKRRGAPPGHKNSYQIFLKQECARLKACNKDLDGHRILRMAIDAWKNMSAIDKQPYVDESKRNKEKYKEAMITYNKQQGMEDTRNEKCPSLCGEYLVTSQPETNDPLFSKDEVGLALKMTEKAAQDHLLLMDWDGFCSLNLPTSESK